MPISTGAASGRSAWKLGATSQAGQTVMGVTEPACGFLLPERYASDANVSLGGFTDLRVEAEVVFRMGTKLAGPGVTASTALRAVDGAAPALGLLDFVFSGKPRGTDFIANSIIAKAIAVGSPFMPAQGLDLAREDVVYEHNGEVVGSYTSAEVMGNPLNALAWLANHLATRASLWSPAILSCRARSRRCCGRRPATRFRLGLRGWDR